LSQRYNLTKGDSMVNFFMEQATQLRMLTQPIPECVMVEDLMRLFPESISLHFKSEEPRGERSIQEAWISWSDSPSYIFQNAHAVILPRETERGRHQIAQNRHQKRRHEL
jgi:hypothetical protein